MTKFIYINYLWQNNSEENVNPQKHFISFYSQYDFEMNVFQLEACFMLHRACFPDSPVGMHDSDEVLF